MCKGFRPAKACPREGGGEGDHRGAVRPQLFGVLDQRDEPGAGCEFGAIYRSPVGRSLPYLILDARYERAREAGVITSQAVLTRSASTGTAAVRACPSESRGAGGRA